MSKITADLTTFKLCTANKNIEKSKGKLSLCLPCSTNHTPQQIPVQIEEKGGEW